MARYKILIKEAVVREYEAIASDADRRRVLARIVALKDDPRPREAGRLPEHDDYRRVRLDGHRVIYQIDDSRKHVTVFRIVQHRR